VEEDIFDVAARTVQKVTQVKNQKLRKQGKTFSKFRFLYSRQKCWGTA